ncbi:MAG TPA: GNAT family N-acetyltransferase [Acidimicrobiales bacterium]|nr:GNAT family N-acetyltransferase [Acidimicrobiales bacterium]
MAADLRAAALDSPEVAPLLAALHADYLARYGPSDEMALAVPADFSPPDGLFVVVVDAGVTVAGGGFRRHGPETCEVKRMWTAPGSRRRGLAGTVLDALEAAAASAGYRRLVLETGPAQPEAARLYAARGYRRIERFGPYPEALAFATELPRPPAACDP